MLSRSHLIVLSLVLHPPRISKKVSKISLVHSEMFFSLYETFLLLPYTLCTFVVCVFSGFTQKYYPLLGGHNFDP